MIFATSYNTIDGHGTLLERAVHHENAFITLLQYIKTFNPIPINKKI